MKGTVLLTGGSGFVGRALALSLAGAGWRVKLPLRGAVAHPHDAGTVEPVIETVPIPGLEEADWPSLLDGVDCVVHAAGLAHATEAIPEERYRVVNTFPTLALAQAARGRVGRFVFLSSIRAQCGPTSEIVLTEDATPRPTDAYGRSKLAAEEGLAALDLAAVSLRPVVVYGPGCKGNMAVLRRVALSGLPLPLSGLEGKRSIVSLDNVASAVLHALSAEPPLRGAMIVTDPEPVTVPGMIRALREGAGLPARLFSVPEALIRKPLELVGKSDWAGRFLGSQTADPSRLLASGWQPVHARPQEGLKAWMAAEALLTRG